MVNFTDLLKDDVDKDKKRAATQAAFKRKFKKNSDRFLIIVTLI